MEDKEVIIPEVVDPGGGHGRFRDQGLKKARLSCAASGFCYLFMIVWGAVIYVWTIIIAYESAGFFAAFLSVIFPVFAQAFWGVQVWVEQDTIINPYCLALLGYLSATILWRAGILLFQNNARWFER